MNLSTLTDTVCSKLQHNLAEIIHFLSTDNVVSLPEESFITN